MENTSIDGKNNAPSDSTSQKGKLDSCKKEVHHSRLKGSSHNKYHIRGTASQSTIEYAKSGEQSKGSAGQRSKSFLEESGLSKASACAQGNHCGKRGTQGSHGDGLFYPLTSNKGRRLLLTDPPEKGEDIFKKPNNHKTAPHLASVITQRLFESPLSFADLVRKGPTASQTNETRQVQLNNTLLSTPQGSTEVSNYLNKYRSYLDNLRKAYEKGNNTSSYPTEHISSATVHPRFYSYTHMIYDICNVSKDDPDLQQLLEKTTTESIRKLWPQPHKSREEYTTSASGGFGEFCGEQSGQGGHDGLGLTTSLDFDNQQQPGQKQSDHDEVKGKDQSNDSSNKAGIFSNSQNSKDATNSKDSGERSEMKSCADTPLFQIGDGAGMANAISTGPSHIRSQPSQPFRSVHDTPAANNEAGGISVLASQQNNSYDWGDGSKRFNDSCLSFKLQNQSALDNLLRHQQMLLQRKQLQKQTNVNPQNQSLQKQHMMPMLNDHEKVSSGMYQTGSSSNHFSNSTNPSIPASLCSQAYSSGTMQAPLMQDPSRLISYGETLGNQETGATGNQEAMGVQGGARSCPRTLKASYACLDPSSPMTLLTKPMIESDYIDGPDNFFFPPQFSSNERIPSKPQFPSGAYNMDDRCGDNAWNYFHDPMSGKQFDQYESQNVTPHDKQPKAKTTGHYDPNHPMSWSESITTQQRPIMKMTSDSSLDCRLASRNSQRHRDGIDASSGCFTTMGPPSTDHHMGIWGGYQQNINSNRTNAVLTESVDPTYINEGLRGDNSLMEDNVSFGNSRLRQWRNPTSHVTVSAEHQDKVPSTLQFPKTMQGDPQSLSPGSLVQKGKSNNNIVDWSASLMTSEAAKKVPENSMPPMNTHNQPAHGGANEGLYSYYQAQDTRYHHLFNNNNATTDSIGQFQTDIIYDKSRKSGNGEYLNKYQDPFASPVQFQTNQIVSETFDCEQVADAVTPGCGEQDMSPNVHSFSNNAILLEQQSQQKRHGFAGKGYENQQESVHCNDELMQNTPSSTMPIRLHQQNHPSNSKTGSDDDILKLSENLENASLSSSNQPFETTNSPPWYEIAPAPTEMESFKEPLENSKGPSFSRNFSYLPEQQEVMKQTIYSETDSQMYQGKAKPRMILGANAPKGPNDAKLYNNEGDDNNRKLKEMMGLCQQENEILQNISQSNNPACKQKMVQNGGPTSPSFQTGNNSFPASSLPYATNGNQMPHIQMSGNRLATNVNQPMQQMYCVQNIVFPPPGQGQPSNLVPTPSVMTNVASSAPRLPHGMMRLPLVDMSRLVYFQPFPMNVSQAHTPNNYNNSSSSNPHVNTCNIITINTAENDFSVNGDKSGRAAKSGGSRGKSGLSRVRSSTDEFPIPVFGMKSGDDATATKGVKVRSQNTNPWDQDLEHDFSSTLFSKMKKLEHGNSKGDVGFVYPEMVCNQQGTNNSSSSFMQWPVTPDMHPEMLDMLAVKKPVTDECGTSRVCWPDMEFMMSSNREQLQAVRKSNKPLGSNKANLISILPKGRTNEFPDGKSKDYASLDKLTNNVK